jgi:hypothetical protein
MFAKPLFCPTVGTSRRMKRVGERSDLRTRAIAGLTICLVLALNGCLPPPTSPTVTHVVLLWLKHPKRNSDRARLVHAAQSLRRMPGVLRVDAGKSIPQVGPSQRKDFDLGVAITFRDRAALQRYEKDPRHLEAMRHYLGPLVRRYEAYNLDDR